MTLAWQNWKLTLAYDGSDFQGWQVQPECATIQGTLSDALERITGERVLPQGSGRTDAGVHALGQVTSFHLLSPIPAENLLRALNRILPESIRILRAENAAPDFHARHSARGKIYEYRVFLGPICPPTMSRYVHVSPWQFDIEAMQAAAKIIVGEHDFTSFAASEPDVGARSMRPIAQAKSSVRQIYLSTWENHPAPHDQIWQGEKGNLLVYRISGNGFLHHMVRNLVGTFLEVGRGRITPESLDEILAARHRSAAGPTAPASGLFLVDVNYTDSIA